jgi:hypothetical protein
VSARRVAAVLSAGRAVLYCTVLLTACPSLARAQVYLGSSGPDKGSWEISGGAIWSDGYDLGTRSAELTPNTGTGPGPFELFTADTRVTTATGGQARLGVYLSRSVALEGGLQFLRPVLSSRLTDDAEEAVDTTATETISRYVVDGALVLHLTGLSFAGGRGLPFVSGGAGYLRELHDRDELIDTGWTYQGGAGLKLWFGGCARRFGVRADVGVAIRDGGFDFSDERRTVPTAGISLAYLF